MLLWLLWLLLWLQLWLLLWLQLWLLLWLPLPTRILLNPNEHALLPLLKQVDAGLYTGPELLLRLGAVHDVLLGEKLLHLAEGAEDGAAVPVVAGVNHLVAGVHRLAVGLHPLQVLTAQLLQH